MMMFGLFAPTVLLLLGMRSTFAREDDCHYGPIILEYTANTTYQNMQKLMTWHRNSGIPCDPEPTLIIRGNHKKIWIKQLDEFLSVVPYQFAAIHWSLDFPPYSIILTSIDYNHPRSKLYYDMHLLPLDDIPYDLSSTEIDRRTRIRNEILYNENLHSLTAKIYYHGVDNYYDMELIYDILTTCPNLRELDLTIADHGGCIVADYAYAFDFTKNEDTFPPLESLKLKAHMSFGYDFDTLSSGQSVTRAAMRHGRYSLSWPWSWLPGPLIETFYYRWHYGGEREGIWGWMPDNVVEFADRWLGGNKTIDERYYAQDRLRREALAVAFEEEHKVENLKTWMQRMDWSKLKTLHLSSVGETVLEELSPALPSLVDLSIDRIDDFGLITLPSFLQSRSTPLQHLSLGELHPSHQTINHNIITSISTPHLRNLRIGLGAIYTHGHQSHTTIWNETFLSNLAHQAPNLTALSIDIERSNLTGTPHTLALLPSLKDLTLHIPSPPAIRTPQPAVFADPDFNRTSLPHLFSSLNSHRSSLSLPPLMKLDIRTELWDIQDQHHWAIFSEVDDLVGRRVCDKGREGDEEIARDGRSICYGGNRRMDVGGYRFGGEGEVEDGWVEDWGLEGEEGM